MTDDDKKFVAWAEYQVPDVSGAVAEDLLRIIRELEAALDTAVQAAAGVSQQIRALQAEIENAPWVSAICHAGSLNSVHVAWHQQSCSAHTHRAKLLRPEKLEGK